ncbi:MAG: carboxypeptidase regulatory-like domain-containing protein [Candidatus Polarisedimenticolia bacterium]
MDYKRPLVAVIALAALWLSWAPPVIAQANITGTIRGSVTDDAGNFLPGAGIEVFGAPLGSGSRSAITNAEGAFVLNGLPVGVYSMTVTLIGYRPYEVVQIVINPDETRLFNVQLPEGLSEKVTVQAERPVVDTSNTSSKEVVDATYVNRLPLVSRRYQQILTLFPGVSNNTGFTEAQYNINGSRMTQNGFRLDGANINDFVTGTFGLNVNQNSIERFEVNTSGFQPEYGEQSGGIANIITKSGTNDFELLYSGHMRSDSMGADLEGFDELVAAADSDGSTDNNNNPRPETQQWQEIAFSGPLVKNKAWFASSFQYWQEDIGSVFSNSERTGDRYHGQFKVTTLMGANHTFVANVATDPSKFQNLITDARFMEGTNFDQTQGAYLIQLRDTWTLNPNAFVETQLFAHHQYLTARPAEEGLGPYQAVITPGEPVSFQGTYYVDQDRSTDRIRLSSALTWQKGTHRLKGGLDYSFMDFTGTMRAEDFTFNQDAVAEYYFGPGSTWSTTLDYRNPDVTDRADAEAAAFIQDTWVIDQKWTVEGGVRADHQTILGETNLAPRLGVAFDPQGRGKSKIFANYGRFYDNVFVGFANFTNSDGYSVSYDLYIAGSGSYGGEIYNYDYAIDGNLKAPYKDSWTFGVEQELPWNLKVGVSTTHWEGKNQLRSTLVTDVSTLPSSVELDPNANAAAVLDTKGTSDYSDWKVYVRKPFSHRFEVIGSYTRSRVRGDVSDDFGFENRADARSLDFTRLGYDRPDVINLSAFGNLPYGLEITGIYRYQSGRLYSPLVVNPLGQTIIDTSYGGKNSERMPPLRSLDLSLSKRFTVGKSQLRLTGQVFNLTNELNIVNVDRFATTGGSPNDNFRAPVSVDFGRIFQIGVEVRF